MTYLLDRLKTQFEDRETETRLAAMIEHISFQRRQNETISSMLTRLEVSRAKAAQEGGMTMNAELTALQLLRACGITARDATHILRDANGNLPETEQAFALLRQRLKEWGRLRDNEPGNLGQLFQGPLHPRRRDAYLAEDLMVEGVEPSTEYHDA